MGGVGVFRLLVISITIMIVIVTGACVSTPSFEEVYTVVSAATLSAGSPIPLPQDEILLTVTGKVGATNQADQIVMDRATIEAVGVVEYMVTDPFEKRKIVYRGVLMRDLLAVWQVESSATQLHLVALNDYAIDIPLEEMRQYPILFGLQADGEYMQPDYRGPAMLVYPMDVYHLDPAKTTAKWIWQIKSIDVQ
jgi:hypothetical protein